MSRKTRQRKQATQHPSPPRSRVPWLEEPAEVIHVETDIGIFVLHTDTPQYSEYIVFRPDHEETAAAVEARKEAGEEISFEEEWRLVARFAELKLAVDDDCFLAELYLDRNSVREEEVQDIIDGTRALLEEIDVGPDGGDFTAYWMEEIVSYSFSPG